MKCLICSNFLRQLYRTALISLSLAGVVCLGFLLLDWWFPFPFPALQRQPAVIVMDHTGTPLRMFLPPDDQWRFPVRLDEVAPVLPQALLASEDRWFYWHPGINPVAVLRAAWANMRAGRIVSGASTIPMQLARMAEPQPRTFWAKCHEAFRALQLEWHFTKSELLEIYLNLTPYGGNLEGIGAAAYAYFGKTPAQLSLGEAALLAVLPRAPSAYNPIRNPNGALAVRNRVLRQLAARGVFPEQAIADALRHPIVTVTWRPPFVAPHFCQLVQSMTDRAPEQYRIQTTLDRRLQRIAEEQVAARITALRRRGIGSAAVVVIENRNRAVRALVGSPGFFETAYAGQVNGATARRSPGSALKPFLYALAVDAGHIIPDSYVLDVPTDFSGYVAENYDGQYRGRVTVREALIHSLNAPAVRLLAQVGLEEFLSVLRRGGLTTLDRPAAEYGLPLILGSGEVTLLDLTNMYATLAEGGLHRPVQIQPEPVVEKQPAERLFSPEAAYLVTKILTAVQRPDLPRAWYLTRDIPVVAWKTGTSYGHRDAWSVGFSARYTIGVWVGNFDGQGQKGLSGGEHAAPLLFDLFRAIEQGGAQLPEPQGLRLSTTQMCAISHELPGPLCPVHQPLIFLSGRSKLSVCSYHRRVFVDAETGELLTGSCLASRPHRSEILALEPPELVAWRQAQGQIVSALPRLSLVCREIPAGGSPQIVSPSATTPYRIRRDAPAAYQQIPLVAHVGSSVEQLFWYQDGVLVATGAPDTTLFLPPQAGTHQLVVVDNAGRSARITYQVE